MLNGLGIRSMQVEDLDFAVSCTAAEQWASENRAVMEGFYQHDPGGCLIAELDHQPVGICVATPYGKSGFIGELIVRPPARGQGIGAALLNHAVAYLHENGAQSAYLDGVPKAVEMYRRNGFRAVCRSLRFSGQLGAANHRQVRQMQSADLPQVMALDLRTFGADRSFFLKRRWQLFPDLSLVMVEEDKLAGFILGWRGEGWVSAGPWVVEKGARHAAYLLESPASKAGDDYFSVGILASNLAAVRLVRSLGFTRRCNSPWRMVEGEPDQLGASAQCFAVGSAAKG